MPVERFRSFDDARKALWVDRDDPALPRRIARLWEFAARLTPPLRAPGVQRFRTIEEANEDRAQRERARVRQLRRERRR